MFIWLGNLVDSNEKELKKLHPLVDEINALEPEFEKLSDDQLLALIKKSDNDAFKEIYYRYFDKLYTFAWLQTGSDDRIKDIIQEVFYRFWKKRKFIFIRKSLKLELVLINLKKH